MDHRLILLPVIEMISKIQAPGKTALQKIVYLIERNGVNLDFDYSIYYYGPYSSLLDYSIQSLELEGAIELEQDGFTQRIYNTDIGKGLIAENGFSGFSQIELEKINFVLDNFANFSARQLELSTTTDYVAVEIKERHGNFDDDLIINGVKNIKGSKFSDTEIANAIKDLKKHGYFN